MTMTTDAAQLEARISEIEDHYDNYGEEPERENN